MGRRANFVFKYVEFFLNLSGGNDILTRMTTSINNGALWKYKKNI